jgi:hypothetical protein
LVRIEVSSDGSHWIIVTGAGKLMDGLMDGAHTLYVRATDAANSVITRSVMVIVDSTAPQVTIITPISGAYIKTQTSIVSWTIFETGSGLAKTELSSDGTNWTVQKGNSGTITVPEGHHVVYVRATDIAGNVMTAMAPFTVDLTPPTVLATSPSGENQSMLVTIGVTFSETMDKASSLVNLNGMKGNISWDGNNLTFTPSDALKGRTVYSVTVYGQDLAGNPVSISWSFKTADVGEISGTLFGRDPLRTRRERACQHRHHTHCPRHVRANGDESPGVDSIRPRDGMEHDDRRQRGLRLL